MAQTPEVEAKRPLSTQNAKAKSKLKQKEIAISHLKLRYRKPDALRCQRFVHAGSELTVKGRNPRGG